MRNFQAARIDAPATRTATMLIAQAKQILMRASRASASLAKIFERSYEPSKYYMRGPGPKSREAEVRAGRTSAGTDASTRG
jgi:hypothetical protein